MIKAAIILGLFIGIIAACFYGICRLAYAYYPKE